MARQPGPPPAPAAREETKQREQAVGQAGLSRGSGARAPPALASMAPGHMCGQNACMTWALLAPGYGGGFLCRGPASAKLCGRNLHHSPTRPNATPCAATSILNHMNNHHDVDEVLLPSANRPNKPSLTIGMCAIASPNRTCVCMYKDNTRCNAMKVKDLESRNIDNHGKPGN